MKRQYFKNFFVATCLWTVGLAFNLWGNLNPTGSNAYTLIWIGYFALTALGLLMVYRLYQFCTSKIRPTGNMGADTLLSVSFILGFAIMAYFGVILNLAAYAALIIGPFYAIWCYYKYRRSNATEPRT